MESTVRVLFRKYLDWCIQHRSARTAEWYEEHLASFLAHLGYQADQPLASLKPYHVVEWVDSHETWGDTFKRGGIIAVQRACNWATEMGFIDATPLKRVAKPPARRRDNPVAPEDFQAILARTQARPGP
jgi:hypothetical protein